MALDIIEKGNRIIIGGTTSTSVEITSKLIYVQGVLWKGATTAGHKMMLKDNDGDIAIPMVSDAPGTSGELMYYVHFPVHAHPFDGLHCDDLDSGTLIIYKHPL